MNYGKRSTSKKRNALISRTSMLEKRAHVSFIRVLFTALIAVCVMVVCLGIGSFRGVIAGAPDVNDVDISPLGYATFLYDDQGTQIRQLSAPTSNRLPVSLDQIPVSLQHAVVAIEDERFYPASAMRPSVEEMPVWMPMIHSTAKPTRPATIAAPR